MSGAARVPLAVLPTPLRRSRRLEEALDCPPLYVKRDDLTGFCVAGNKARKLEYLLADAAARGCDVLVTGGSPGSNHTAATAAAARVADLDCVVVVAGRPGGGPPPVNVALARRLGARLTYTGDDDRASVDPAIDRAGAELTAAGRRPYVVPRGGASAVGAVGYAVAAAELGAQLRDQGVDAAAVVVATGSGGTQAGLVAGRLAGGHRWRVVGASVSRPVAEIRERVLRLARGCAARVGGPQPTADHVDVRDARGPGFGQASAEGDAATRAADRAGLLLDPVYTAKALAIVPALVAEGLAGPVVFLHTGGLPAALGHAASMSDPTLRGVR